MNPNASTLVDPPMMAPESAPFWEAANRGELLVKACNDCGKLHWYPRALCPFCMSANTQWRKTAGSGEIYSYTVLAIDPPTIPAYVRLREGLVLLTQLIDVRPEQLFIGAAVEVCFTADANGQSIPIFRMPKRSVRIEA